VSPPADQALARFLLLQLCVGERTELATRQALRELAEQHEERVAHRVMNVLCATITPDDRAWLAGLR